jgi:hypothetical protein
MKSMHTVQELHDIINKGINRYNIPIDDLWVCLARRIDIEEEYEKKAAMMKLTRSEIKDVSDPPCANPNFQGVDE